MKKFFVSLIMMFGILSATAATLEAVKLNEVMVENNSSIVDDYGEHTAWIELFNGNFGPIDISSLYLTNDTTGNNKFKYPVPIGDVLTRIDKRQHVVFYADGQPNKGTFHTNFTLTPGEDNLVALYDAGGHLLDIVMVPATVEADQTFARAIDGVGDWKVRNGEGADYITPSSANIIRDTNEKISMFAENDANGFSMTIMAMGIVFSALLLLCLAFYGIGKINAAISRTKKREAHGIDVAAADDVEHDTGEEIAAIIMALHQHLNAHDTESTILTINKVKRAYSPWSSKIYGLRTVPEHKHR